MDRSRVAAREPGEDEARAARYHRIQLLLGVAALAVGAAYLVGALVIGAGATVARAATRIAAAWWWQVAVVALALGAGHAFLTAPLAWTRGYWLPRRFGLLHQPFAAWLRDRAKAAVLAGVLGLAGLEAIYALLRSTAHWWLAAAAVVLAAHVVVATVLPVWIVPLFYRLTPLGDVDLRARLLALARRAGVPAVEVWVVDQSRKSRTANAALVGLGRTRRIVLFDTLLQRFSPEEIESVLAHELGHHAHGDVRRGLIATAVLTLVTFAAADRVLGAGVGLWHLGGVADPAGVPWLALVLGGLGLGLTPLANGFSRRIERQADDFALALTGNPAAFIGALERLGRLNLAERRPHRLKEVFLSSHPSLERRIARARAAAA